MSFVEESARLASRVTLELFSAETKAWFQGAFGAPTEAQHKAWPLIAAGQSTLLLAPTGSGKTLAAFLRALDRLVFTPTSPPSERLRVVYVSPLKALAADVERNLARPLSGITELAERVGRQHHVPRVMVALPGADDRLRAHAQPLQHAPCVTHGSRGLLRRADKS